MPDVTFGSPTVSGNVNVNVSETSYNGIVAGGSRTTNGTTTLITVPAGKRARIFGAYLMDQQGTGAGYCYINVAGTGLLYIQVSGSTDPNRTASISFSKDACPTADAGETVTLVNSSRYCFGSIVYAYEDI